MLITSYCHHLCIASKMNKRNPWEDVKAFLFNAKSNKIMQNEMNGFVCSGIGVFVLGSFCQKEKSNALWFPASI